MRPDELGPYVGASLEVLRHHGELHAACCLGGPIETMCEHGAVVIIGCTWCGRAVYVVYTGVNCVHAVEVRNGLVPSGVWTEVKAS